MTRQLIIAGAQRCGTTYLYGLLDQHPDIEMAKPVRPEPKFFLETDLYERGRDFYLKTYYVSSPEALWRGEKSTSYIEFESCAERIYRYFPDVLILLVVRNPIFRAISNYRFSVANGIETLDVEQAFLRPVSEIEVFDGDRFSVSPLDYLRRGRYIDYIEKYLRHIPREQLRVLFYEELIGGPGAISNLYRDLGVRSEFFPEHGETSLNSSVGPPVVVSDSLMERMKAYYRESNARLFEFLDRDPAIWDDP